MTNQDTRLRGKTDSSTEAVIIKKKKSKWATNMVMDVEGTALLHCKLETLNIF